MKKIRLWFIVTTFVIVHRCHSMKELGLDELLLDATKSHNLTNVIELLHKGANPNCINSYRQTPLHLLASTAQLDRQSEKINDSLKIGLILIKHGADIQAKDFYLNTPLHSATLSDNLPIARLLIDCGAQINALDCMLRTPIHNASFIGNLPLVIYLLKSIIKPYQPAVFNKTKILLLGILKPDAQNPSCLNKLPVELLHTILFYAPEYLFNKGITYKTVLNRVDSSENRAIQIAHAYKELARRKYRTLSNDEQLSITEKIKILLTIKDSLDYNAYKHAETTGNKCPPFYQKLLSILNPSNVEKTSEKLFIMAVCADQENGPIDTLFS